MFSLTIRPSYGVVSGQMKTTSTTDNQFSILDYSPIGQFVIDDQMEVIFWNQRMVEWTDIRKGKIINTNILDHFPHLASPEFTEIFDQTRSDSQPIELPFQAFDCFIPLALPDGKLRVQNSEVSRFTRPNFDGNFLIFSIQDVTSLTTAQEETQKATLQVSEETTIRKKTQKKLLENEKRLAQLANHDVLTKLPNRRLLSDRLQQAIIKSCRSDSKIAVLFLDLDRFKKINDTLGHDVGDLLLIQVAQRLQECIRAGDTVARLGGDEFVVILEDIHDNTAVIYIAKKILKSMAQPINLKGYELVVTTSIGVSIFPHDGDSVEGLLKSADTAMYSAKDQGGDTCKFFVAEMNKMAIEMLMLEGQLRKAIELEQLELYYQPKFNLSTNQLIGAEALIRWNHPELGLLTPAKFIPLAEDTGLIIPIGEWVLRAACEQIKTWASQGYRPVKIAVNLSARQFHQHDLIKTVSDVLKDCGIGPKFLELELTESVIMQDAQSTINTLDALHDMGISLSIDDFGTGYSSLSYLKKFPINALKIDQSFVRDISQDSHDAAIVFSTIALAHSMILPVIAEGIENEKQFRFLQRHGCDQGQGYLFGKPMPASEFIQFLQKKPL